MKKVLAIVLSLLFVVLSLAGCSSMELASDTTARSDTKKIIYKLGSVSDDAYTNKSVGIKIDCPDSFRFMTEKEIENFSGAKYNSDVERVTSLSNGIKKTTDVMLLNDKPIIAVISVELQEIVEGNNTFNQNSFSSETFLSTYDYKNDKIEKTTLKGLDCTLVSADITKIGGYDCKAEYRNYIFIAENEIQAFNIELLISDDCEISADKIVENYITAL